MNSGGKCLLGQAPKADEAGPARRQVDRWVNDPLGPIISRVAQVPYNIRLAIGGLSFLIFAFFAFLWLTGGDEQPLPTSLEGRTQLVARAFVDNNLTELARVSSPGTTRLLKQWLDEARPDYWGANLTGTSMLVNTEVLYQDPRTGMACVVATLTRDQGQEIPPRAGLSDSIAANSISTAQKATVSTGGIEMLLYWVLDSSGQWLLDVERVLKNSTGP